MFVKQKLQNILSGIKLSNADFRIVIPNTIKSNWGKNREFHRKISKYHSSCVMCKSMFMIDYLILPCLLN